MKELESLLGFVLHPGPFTHGHTTQNLLPEKLSTPTSDAHTQYLTQKAPWPQRAGTRAAEARSGQGAEEREKRGDSSVKGQEQVGEQ